MGGQVNQNRPDYVGKDGAVFAKNSIMTKAISRIIAGLTLLAVPVLAARPPEITVQGVRLTLRGEAVLKVGYLFKVYEAGFYVGDTQATEAALMDVPKRLEITYLRDLRAADIVEIGNDTLARQIPEAQWVALQERLAIINQWYVDVKAGDRYTLTYVPGHGSELALNGKPLGVIEGADFAAAYFGIWLDPRTKYQDFRKTLLGLQL